MSRNEPGQRGTGCREAGEGELDGDRFCTSSGRGLGAEAQRQERPNVKEEA